jgi:hypothetical protein
MRKALPIITLLWGTAMVLNVAFAGAVSSGAYGAGKAMAAAFGIVLIVASSYAIVRSGA